MRGALYFQYDSEDAQALLDYGFYRRLQYCCTRPGDQFRSLSFWLGAEGDY